MAENTKLLPCPMCAGEGEAVCLRIGEDAIASWARCLSCGLRTAEIEDAYSDLPSAAAAWNTRAATPAMDREAVELTVRISHDEYPEIIQAARWLDEDNGTDHFEPGVGFIVDDPIGLSVPIRWVDYLPTIEAALLGLDHEKPHPLDFDTLERLAREGKKPLLYDSAVHCFISGEHTPAGAMATSSLELWIAKRFFDEYFMGWAFDPTDDYPATPAPAVDGDDNDSPAARLDMVRVALTGIIENPASAVPLARAGLDFCDLSQADREGMRGDPLPAGEVREACQRIQQWMDDEHRDLRPGQAAAPLSYEDVSTLLRAALSHGAAR